MDDNVDIEHLPVDEKVPKQQFFIPSEDKQIHT